MAARAGKPSKQQARTSPERARGCPGGCLLPPPRAFAERLVLASYVPGAAHLSMQLRSCQVSVWWPLPAWTAPHRQVPDAAGLLCLRATKLSACSCPTGARGPRGDPPRRLAWHQGALASRGRAALPDAVLADPALSFISYTSQGDNDSPFGKPDARAAMGTEAGWHLTRARCPVNPGGLRATARRVAARPGHSQAPGPA